MFLLFAIALLSTLSNADASYVGCFKDANTRIMSVGPVRGKSFEQCQEYCEDKGSDYMGYENGNECFCGTESDNFTLYEAQLSDSDCGNDSPRLGGPWKMAVYKLGGASSTSTGAYSAKPGCWGDSGSDRAFAKRMDDNLSFEQCASACASAGDYDLMAIQYQKECYCGSSTRDNYQKHGETNGCTNGKGGSYAMNVYSLGSGSTDPVVPATPAPVTAVAPVASASVSKIGCFKDVQSRNQNERIFTVKTDGSGLSPDECAAQCQASNAIYDLIAMQYQTECWCGLSGVNDFRRVGASSSCANGLGGTWNMDVYSIGNAVIPAALPTPKADTTPYYTAIAGCWIDGNVCSSDDGPISCQDGGKRMFPVKLSKAYPGLDECAKDCSKRAPVNGKKFKYMAKQYGDECWCGLENNDYTQFGQTVGCADGMGGAWSANVYEFDPTLTRRPTPAYGDSKYLGCYKDTASNRIFSFRGASRQSLTQCAAQCKGIGAEFMAMQDGKECWCGRISMGDNYTKNSANLDTNMSFSCGQMGGLYTAAVYQLSDGGTPFPTATLPTRPPVNSMGLANLGCWRDSSSQRIMSYKATQNNLGLEGCMSHCAGKNYKMMGYQYNSECYCSSYAGYKVNGEATGCRNGVGGSYAMNVYGINGYFPVEVDPIGQTGVGYKALSDSRGNCFRDVGTKSGRVCSYRAASEMSLTACAATCSKITRYRFNYQDGRECWCCSGIEAGNYAMHGVPDESDNANQKNGATFEEACNSGVGGVFIANFYDVVLPEGETQKPHEAPQDSQGRATSAAYERMGDNDGCYKDSVSDRVCGLRAASEQRIDECAATCKRYKRYMFNYQDGRECWCCAAEEQSTWMRHGKHDKSSAACTGGRGGVYEAVFYKVKLSEGETQAPVAAPPTPKVSDVTYSAALGHRNNNCYQDDQNDRMFNYRAQSRLGLQGCADKCAEFGVFDKFGYQNGKECWCGRAEESLPKNADRDACPDGLGGPYTASVYHISIGNGPAITPSPLPAPKPDTPMEPVDPVDPVDPVMPITTINSHLGCYADNQSNDRKCSTQMAGNVGSVAECAGLCSGFEGFGVQYNVECYCCTSAEMASIGRDRGCESGCANGRGGSYKMDLYRMHQGGTVTLSMDKGCYKDSTSNRIFAVSSAQVAGSSAVADCAQQCADAGYQYSGNEYGVECWCDSGKTCDGTISHHQVSESQVGGCSSGTGGSYSMNVYANTIAQHLGCWTDVSRRVFSKTASASTLADCANACEMQGESQMAMENQDECYCGTGVDYMQHGASTACADNGQGGPWGMSVYYLVY